MFLTTAMTDDSELINILYNKILRMNHVVYKNHKKNIEISKIHKNNLFWRSLTPVQQFYLNNS